MNSNKAIMRVFEVSARPDRAEALQRKLEHTSVSVVNGKLGNLGYYFGKKDSCYRTEFVCISIWSDFDSIKSDFGEDSESSYLPKGYVELINACSVKHFVVEGRSEF